ncbi:hypothetical protein FACS1894187_07120 [Synergistales bacterium]|nr:hypothetical protein FACS1894187_07120 [Synergistales bacterium]
MATLDVSDVLDTPEFNSVFSVARRNRDIGDNGRSVVAEELLTFNGVVQPISNRDLERLPEVDRLNGGITVWCRERLRNVGETHVADEILWGGSRYQVVHCDKWAYGDGYYEIQAMLVLQPEGYDNADE